VDFVLYSDALCSRSPDTDRDVVYRIAKQNLKNLYNYTSGQRKRLALSLRAQIKRESPERWDPWTRSAKLAYKPHKRGLP
jgi:hypothetical protein